ncbi:MAG: hypothetical protein R3261_04930, partial [Alphaproteobacteria bacterium]|nr:hypothetical protein [Alphaproteobacteria bacterium]
MKSKLKITFALLPVVTALSGCGTDGIAAGVAAAAALTVAIADNWDEISNSPALVGKDLSEVSSKRVCFYAKDSSTNNWTTEPNFQGYVNEAKKRGLWCGGRSKVVATIDSETSRNFKSKSDAFICGKATWADGSGWNYSRHEYVAEAQNRGLGCETNIASTQNNSSKNTSSPDVDVSHMKDTELCRNATHSTPPQWKPIHMPEVREALSRGLHCDVSLATSVEDTTPYIHKKSNHDIAIIIGNRTYSKYSTDIPDVDTAQFDAIAFKQFAKDYLQISEENIIYIPDAKTTDLLRVFGNERDHRGLAYRMIREDISNLYVYYSGHGAPSFGESPLL